MIETVIIILQFLGLWRLFIIKINSFWSILRVHIVNKHFNIFETTLSPLRLDQLPNHISTLPSQDYMRSLILWNLNYGYLKKKNCANNVFFQHWIHTECVCEKITWILFWLWAMGHTIVYNRDRYDRQFSAITVISFLSLLKIYLQHVYV